MTVRSKLFSDSAVHGHIKGVVKTDDQLLAEYVGRQSESAYTELVTRHAGWIYGLARRTLADEHAAHDVTQAVFLLLSQKAARLRDRSRLGAWLVQTTRLTARQYLRDERRRRHREAAVAKRSDRAASGTTITREALVILDSAIAELNRRDRELVVLRFYQGLSMADVGRVQAISEDTARKRVAAVVMKLRMTLRRKLPHTDSLAALAALPTLGRPLPLTPDWIHFSPRTASARSIRLAKGISRMLKIKQIIVAGLILAAIPIGGAVIVRAELQDNTNTVAAPQPASASPNSRYVKDNGDGLLRTVVSEHCLARVSPEGTRLTGYSIETGAAAEAPQIAEKFDVNKAIVSSWVAVYPADTAVLAFSARTGTWSSLPLTPQMKVTEPSVGSDCAFVYIDSSLYLFNASTGKWSVPIP